MGRRQGIRIPYYRQFPPSFFLSQAPPGAASSKYFDLPPYKKQSAQTLNNFFLGRGARSDKANYR